MSVAVMAARDAACKMPVKSQLKAQSVYGRVNPKVNSKEIDIKSYEIL